MKILASTSFIGTTGYANHAQSFFTALDKFVPIKIRNFTVGKTWNWPNNEPHSKEPYFTPQIKNMLHQQTLWEADGSRKDYSIYNSKDFTPDINIVLNEHNHHYFYDSYSGYKIAYNVWESTRYSDEYFKRLLEFDELWVPTEWQKEISVKQGYPEDKIYVIPEGVDGTIFKPKFKLPKPDKFKFIVIGRWDYRKGIKESIEGFLKAFPNNPNVELYISVENPYSVDGMSSTEERLKYYGLEDDRIKILKFLDRKSYIKLLQESQVFLSCARAEGWNLPLIEALACGIPSIYTKCSGQLEYTKGKGLAVNVLGEEPATNGEGLTFEHNIPGNFYKPDLDDLVLKIKDAYNNWDIWKKWHLARSQGIREEYSWKKQAKLAYNRLKEIEIKPVISEAKLDVHFADGPFVTLRNATEPHQVEFIKDGKIEFSTELKNDHWSKTFHKYYIDWEIKLKDKTGNLVISHKYNASGKRVYIALGSKALGDTLAWFPYVEEFRKKHNCHVIVSTFWNKFFEGQYPKLEFIEPGTVVNNIYAMYELGWYYTDEGKIDYFKQPIDPKTITLQKTATNILGLEYKEIIPKINVSIKERPWKEKYICFSPHASTSAKYWHNETGWQDVINYVTNALGYKMIMISKESYDSEWETNKLPQNKKFKNIIDATGDHPIEDIMNIIYHSEMYIGVSSGLSWLSWALQKPVVMISGFSSAWTEFSTKMQRVINKDVCNSCFNNSKLDASDWDWCPNHKNTPRQFECTKKITSDKVIECITHSLV